MLRLDAAYARLNGLRLPALLKRWPTVQATCVATGFALVACLPIVKIWRSSGYEVASSSFDLTYNFAVLVPNYFANGFIRRGLSGTIMSLIDVRQTSASGVSFHIFSAIWLSIAISIFLRKVFRANQTYGVWLALVILISPAFRLWSTDIGRTDLFSTGFVAFALLAAMHRQWQAAAIVLVIGSLAHETAVIMGLPLLIAAWYLDYRDGRADIRVVTYLLITLVTLLLLVIFLEQLFGSKPDQIAEHVRTIAPPSALRDIALYVIVGGFHAIIVSACGSQANPAYPLYLFSGFIFVPFYAVILGYRSSRTHILVLILVAILPSLLLIFVAFDFGRWFVMAAFNVWLAAGLLVIRLRRDDTSPRLNLFVAGPVLGLLIAMGAPTIFFANHLTDRLARKIWGQPMVSTVDSISKCDPHWRDVASGKRAMTF